MLYAPLLVHRRSGALFGVSYRVTGMAFAIWLHLNPGCLPLGRMLTAFASRVPIPLLAFAPWPLQLFLTLVFATLLWRLLLLSVKAKALQTRSIDALA